MNVETNGTVSPTLEDRQVTDSVPSMATTTSVLRAAIREYPSRYKLAIESGIQQSALSRFVNGKATLTLDSLDALAPVLGLALVGTRAKRSKAKAQKAEG